MRYRMLGGTGLRVSEIGLGCEGFLDKDDAFTQKVLDLAIERGVNCMDFYSPDPAMHRRVGKAIGARRKDFLYQAHLCTVWQDGQYKATRNMREIVPSFEGMLKGLGTDYVDIGMSSHNPLVALEAVKSGEIEVLMFSVNPCYDLLPGDEDVEKLFAGESYERPLFNLDPVRKELYETCQRMGVGITVMKVFGGGDLLTDNSPAGRAMTPSQCIHYALTRPAVASVLVGAHSAEQLASSLYYEEATEEERDYAPVFASLPKMSWTGHCMYCGHCAPCPRHIDVADVTKFLHLARAQGAVPETVREHYAALSAKGGDCIACGACEKRCPFGVHIIENMRAAREMFGA